MLVSPFFAVLRRFLALVWIYPLAVRLFQLLAHHKNEFKYVAFTLFLQKLLFDVPFNSIGCAHAIVNVLYVLQELHRASYILRLRWL